MANSANIKLGVCSVVFNSVDLGHTLGGVEVSYKPKYVDIMADLYGDTRINKKLVGEELTVKVPLAEYTIKNLNVAMPNSTLAGAGNTRITLGHQAGQDAKALAALLYLHPIAEAGKTFDVVLYKAFVASAINIKHDNKGERIIEVTFEALLDETRSDGNYLGLIGDSTT